jgi:ATP-binding cassette, subfamily B, bacterial CvaB/MchF/RaxB
MMEWLDTVSTGFKKKLPMILQTEATECGLACLAMIASFYGLHADLRSLRQKFQISLKGASLSQLIKIAGRLEISNRAVRADMDELHKLRLPCLLHWRFNHFVVLREVHKHGVTIHDPAQGMRRLSFKDASAEFTGVVLELWPSLNFEPSAPLPRLKLRELWGKVVGLKRVLGQALLLAGALEVFSLLTPLLTQWIIDNVLVSADSKLLSTLVIGFGIMLLVQQGVSALRAWSLMHLGTTLGVQWKANIFNHLLKLPTQFFEKRHIGDVVSRFGTIDSIQQTLTTSFLSAVLDGAMTVLTVGMMFVYAPKLTLIPVITMLLYMLGRWGSYVPFRSASQDVIVRSAKTQSHFLETVRGIKAIQLFQREDERQAAWLSLLVDQVNSGLKSQKLQLLYQQANALLFGMEGIVVMYVGATMVMSGELSIGMLMAFNSYKGQFNSRVGGLIDNYFSVKLLQLQGERLADIALHPVEDGRRTDEWVERPIKGHLEANGVQFRYAHGEPTILAGVDFQISPGESVSIVGPTGCGKTTLINLMLGIIKPTRGEIKIDGVNLDEIGIANFRTMVGTVLQDDSLFAGSIADNIAFFDEDVQHERVIRAAAAAGIHVEIVAMPMGYNTLVGDMGSVLSGGQKQRVLLARALYKNPAILIMDEATCHLNVEKEREVLESIKELKITRITIAHRPETIAAADRVFALSGGKIAWQGPPSLLSGWHAAARRCEAGA